MAGRVPGSCEMHERATEHTAARALARAARIGRTRVPAINSNDNEYVPAHVRRGDRRERGSVGRMRNYRQDPLESLSRTLHPRVRKVANESPANGIYRKVIINKRALRRFQVHDSYRARAVRALLVSSKPSSFAGFRSARREAPYDVRAFGCARENGGREKKDCVRLIFHFCGI